ncbi:cysteine peptidase family C39 domain-containing protein [Mesoplasma melaleucae]|uniref:cysteine peptidase family C39 domain-containing protein n=1 Tax=Mesoplasma melaleucae TaxID=81459 RepID=UPI0022872850|nr:cysteine peptidase family C39 domain-containing protein [Mesoplasma melaleucae]
MKGEAFRVDQDFDELKNKTPFLAQVINEEGMLHFVVVKQIEKDQIIVYDPSKNKKQTTIIKNFLLTFNGNVLLFKPNFKKFKQSFNFKLTKLKSLVNFSFVYFILLNLILILLFIIDTQFLKMFFNLLVNEKQQELLYLFLIIILVLSILCKTLSNSVLN